MILASGRVGRLTESPTTCVALFCRLILFDTDLQGTQYCYRVYIVTPVKINDVDDDDDNYRHHHLALQTFVLFC